MKFVKDYLDSSRYIKLGSKDGAGFIFCGKLKDFLDISDEMSIRQQSILRDRKLKAEEVMGEFDFRWNHSYKPGAEKVYDLKMDEYKDKPEAAFLKKHPTKEAYVDAVHESKYKACLKRLNKATKALEGYTPILERPVVETYNSELINCHGERDLIVIFEGMEVGPWWSLDEYERGWVETDTSSNISRTKKGKRYYSKGGELIERPQL